MIDNFDEVPKEEVVGLTQTGAEVVKPIEPPKTKLDLGQYYNDRIPTEMVSSWEANAENQSNLKFQENVVKAKGSMLRTRQEMEQAGVEGQTQLALGQYMREQSAEKAGWTGGYMLDQARQGEYLKSTIQAQLYGQQELQKYGMESQLEAARLAYDLGKEQLALQYYNEAYQKALTEAQLFGYYVAPETRDMFNQYQAALTALAANPGDERALDVKTKVEDFYKNGQQLTEADIRKFSTATFEMNQYMEAKLEAALTLIDEDPSKFIVKDASGNYAVDANNRYVMLDFDDVNSDDLMTFLRSDNEAGSKTSDYAVKSYMRYLGQRTINGYFSTLEEDEGPTAEGFLSWVESNPSLVNEWFKSTIAEGNKADFFTQVGDKFTADLTGANGSLSVTFDLKNNKLTVTGGTDGASGSGGGGTSSIYSSTWASDNDITDFKSFLSTDQTYKNGLFSKISYTTTNDTTQNLYVYGKHSFGSDETALNDFFKYKEGTSNGEFVYKFEFTDWNKEINGDNWTPSGWAGADEQGINKNFKIEYYLKDGKDDVLNFELGNTLNNYYGFMGAFLSDSELTYREIDKTTGALNLVNYDDFISSFEPGEIRYVKVDHNGNGERRVLVTKDPNGQLRLIEAIGGKQTENHKTLLQLMGYKEDAIGTISLG